MSENLVGQAKDIRGRTWQEAFYLQTKAFLEKNSEHIKEIERLKAENACLRKQVERMTEAGDAMADDLIYKFGINEMADEWKEAKEGKGQP